MWLCAGPRGAEETPGGYVDVLGCGIVVGNAP